MKIENPLLTGTDLPALKFQAEMLAGTGNQLAIESASGEDKKKALNPFLGFVSRIKNFAVDKLNLIPNLKEFVYKPQYSALDRVALINYAKTRSMVIPAIPDTNAKVAIYLDYLHELSDIVNSVVTYTIPNCKVFFSDLLEDVSLLASESQTAAVDRLSNNQYALNKLNKDYPGIIKRNDKNIGRSTMAMQYDSMKDFVACQEHLAEITAKVASINVVEASRQVNELNEIISRVIMKVKQTKELEVNGASVKAISMYLYTLAEEIALIPAFATHLQMAVKTLDEQLIFIDESLVA